MAEKLDALDTFDYPTDHPLYLKKNVKLLGKMKDECAGQALYEFVGLRSKCIRFGYQIIKLNLTQIYLKTFTI